MLHERHEFYEHSQLDALLKRKPLHDDAHFDITAMIDLVFMMNIFFLVTTIGASLVEIDLPRAQHAVAVDGDLAVFVTVMPHADGDAVSVYLADGVQGEAITDALVQEDRIRAAVALGRSEGKTAVVFKAEKDVRLREMARLTSAAVAEGMQLNLAVVEKE
ncbi:MAG: biopolymer transporter ExbD [Planctomycetia bacterium]|nr:biopolymer transporter ExbD [Planctomycetia bacterium]